MQNLPARVGVPARILIVDDHPNTAQMLARVIQKLSDQLEVLTAFSGEDAITQLGDGYADVLITDYMLPGMSGLDLIEKLQNGRKPAHTILITAYNTASLEAKVHHLGVNDFLVKPVDPEKVRDIVSESLKEIVLNGGIPFKEFQKQPFKILIADDNPDNLRLLEVRLKDDGFEYIAATDGQQALDIIKKEIPDLALLDVNMPIKDGFDVLKEMRADIEISHIPVIMITAARMEVEDIQEGLSLGADDYVTKPVDWRELSARIRTKLRVKLAEDALRSRNKELGVLPDISQDFSSKLNIEDLTKNLLTRTVVGLGAENGYLVIFYPDGENNVQIHQVFDPSPWTWDDLNNRIASSKMLIEVKRSRAIKVLNNTVTDDTWLKIPNDKTRSAVLLPLLGRRSVIGVLVVTHTEGGFFKGNKVNILQVIAGQAAIAVDNALLFDMERKRVKELTGLNQVTREINQFSNLDDLSDKLPRLIKDNFGFPTVGFWLNKHGVLKLESLADDGSSLSQVYLEIGPNQAADSGQPTQLSGSFRLRKSANEKTEKPPDQSVFAVPLTRSGNLLGVLSIHSNRAGAFNENDRVLMETLSAQVATILDRITLIDSILKHDLNNSIQEISDYSDRLAKAGPLNERQADLLKSIGKSIENIHNMALHGLG
jgi:DNA-binding response OmpR family regulator/putative methionine-R-sulfoxide reductase with GAF domain